MKPAAFVYHRASTVEEAIDLMTRLGEEARFLAGGQSLVPMMNFRLARPSALVDISRIAGLAYLRPDGAGLRIGALTRHRAIESTTDPAVLGAFGVLPRAARWVGHYPIRTMGTFGGSIAHADPSAEWPLLAVLLDAEMVALGPGGERVIPARDFFQGIFTTALEPGELLLEVRFPAPAPRAALTEFARRRGDFAIVAAAVALETDGRLCTEARVALGGVDATPVRIPEAEKALQGQELTAQSFETAGQIAARQIDPPSDIHAGGAYRRHLASVLVRRALAEAVKDD